MVSSKILLPVLFLAAVVVADITRMETTWKLDISYDCSTAPVDQLCSPTGQVSSATFSVGHHNYIAFTDDRGVHFFSDDRGQLRRLGMYPSICPLNFMFVGADNNLVFSHDQTSKCSCDDSESESCVGIESGILVDGSVEVLVQGSLSLRLRNVFPTPTTIDWVSTEPSNACSPVINADEVAGKWALVRRGECAFQTKIENAIAAGAIGIVVQNRPATTGASGMSTSSPASVPFFMITYDLGERIRSGAVTTLQVGGSIGFEVASSPASGFVVIALEDVLHQEIIENVVRMNNLIDNVYTWFRDEKSGLLWTLSRDDTQLNIWQITSAADAGSYFAPQDIVHYLGRTHFDTASLNEFVYMFESDNFILKDGNRFVVTVGFYTSETALWLWNDIADSPVKLSSYPTREPQRAVVYDNRWSFTDHANLGNYEPAVIQGLDWSRAFNDPFFSLATLSSVTNHRFFTDGSAISTLAVCGDFLWAGHASDGVTVHSLEDPTHPVLIAKLNPTPEYSNDYTVGVLGASVWERSCHQGFLRVSSSTGEYYQGIRF